jgi:hypothetical protein
VYARSEFTGYSSDVTFFYQDSGTFVSWKGEIASDKEPRLKTCANRRPAPMEGQNGRQISQMIIRPPTITRLHRKSLSSIILNSSIACPLPM